MSSTMLATAARILHRLLQRNGLNADALYIECGLDPLKLNDSKARYQVDRIRKLASLADARIDNPCWGMAAGDLWKPTDFHAIGYTFMASRTLESALHRLERYQRIVIQDLTFRSITEGDNVSFHFVPPPADADIPAFHDARVSMMMRMCREAYGENLPVREVTLTHPWQPCSYEEYFGCPVRYDAQYSSLTLPLEVLHHPLPAVNRDLARANERILTEIERVFIDNTFTGRARGEILDNIASGQPSANMVAHALAVSQRTLQRKLQEEGTTFQALLNEVRKTLAQQYIRSGDYGVLEATYLTGFANPPAFFRAYKKWTGRTPSEDRAAQD